MRLVAFLDLAQDVLERLADGLLERQRLDLQQAGVHRLGWQLALVHRCSQAQQVVIRQAAAGLTWTAERR